MGRIIQISFTQGKSVFHWNCELRALVCYRFNSGSTISYIQIVGDESSSAIRLLGSRKEIFG